MGKIFHFKNENRVTKMVMIKKVIQNHKSDIFILKVNTIFHFLNRKINVKNEKVTSDGLCGIILLY